MIRSCCPLCKGTEIAVYTKAVRHYGVRDYDLDLSQCRNCRFVFLREEVSIPYDAEYLNLEEVITLDDEFARFRAEERVAKIATLVPPGEDRRFLDIGIGDGLLLKVAENAGYRTFGLDVNENGLEIARSTYGITASLSLDPLSLAFGTDKFHVIHMNEVIEHVPNPMDLLRQCRERLAENGYLVVQTGNIDSFASLIKGSAWNYIRPVHLNYFSTTTLLRAIRMAGFAPRQRITSDWRLATCLSRGFRLLKTANTVEALKFITFRLTAVPHGIRRTLIVYAN